MRSARLLALVTGLATLLPAPAAAGPGASLPDADARRYRVEIGGQAVGVATLSVRCERARCTAAFETALRLPDAGGGGVSRRAVKAITDRAGTILEAEAGGRWRRSGGEAVASIVVEAVLASAADGERRCADVEDVESGRSGRACALRRGAWLDGEILGEPTRFRAAPGALPDEVLLPGQGSRFVVDASATIPPRAPAAFGNAVPATPGAELDRGATFCGRAAEPDDPAPPPPGLPRDFPERGGCQEVSLAWLRSARDDGLQGRAVVGVAWDGRRFVWHQWAEVAAAGRWIAVDPSFRQLPAQAPRFAVARFAPGDEGARAEAGRRVLACWGKGVSAPAAPYPGMPSKRMDER